MTTTGRPEYNPSKREIIVRFTGETGLNYTYAKDRRQGLNAKTIALVDALDQLPSVSSARTVRQAFTETPSINLIVLLNVQDRLPDDVYDQVMAIVQRELPEIILT